MKVSELILHLQGIAIKHGDLDVKWESPEGHNLPILMLHSDVYFEHFEIAEGPCVWFDI